MLAAKNVKGGEQLVQHLHHVLRVGVLGHWCEADYVHEEDADAGVAVRQLRDGLGHCAGAVGGEELDDVAGVHIDEHVKVDLVRGGGSIARLLLDAGRWG